MCNITFRRFKVKIVSVRLKKRTVLNLNIPLCNRTTVLINDELQTIPYLVTVTCAAEKVHKLERGGNKRFSRVKIEKYFLDEFSGNKL